MNINIGLSTSWLSWRVRDVDKMIDEIKSYGFNFIELDFGLSKSDLERFITHVENNNIVVSSVHNFCPFPKGVESKLPLPDVLDISHKDPEMRNRAVTQTMVTIDYAKRLGAKAVVMHSGEIPVKNRTKKLIELLENDKVESNKFSRVKAKLFREREKYREEYSAYTLESYEKVNDYAVKNDILIGVENRYYAHQIPNLEEMELILNTFKGGNLRYWHDVGHAQLNDNLKIFYHEEYVNAFKDKIVGIHIHDIVRSSDHRAPGTAIFDFTRIMPFLQNNNIIKIIEVHHPTSPSELRYGLKFITELIKKAHDEK